MNWNVLFLEKLEPEWDVEYLFWAYESIVHLFELGEKEKMRIFSVQYEDRLCAECSHSPIHLYSQILLMDIGQPTVFCALFFLKLLFKKT